MFNGLKQLFSFVIRKVAAPQAEDALRARNHVLSREVVRLREIAAGYDAAETTDNNRRHFELADGFSANAANNPGVRRTLRNRTRYEVKNNCYARGITLTVANDVIGTGPRLQLKSLDRTGNNATESAFRAWAKDVRLAEKLRTMRIAQTESGEGFLVMTTNPNLRHPVKLDLREIEAEQVTSQSLMPGVKNEVDGVVFDDFGNPTMYRILKHHPGDASFYGGIDDTENVDARYVLHLFRRDRPMQLRGIPHFTPALPLFAQLRRYTLAVLSAAEIAADFAATLETEAGADDEEIPNPFETLEIERGMMTALPAGSKMSQLKAEQPTGTYTEFTDTLLREIPRCENVPFIVATLDSTKSNYASGRLDHQTYYRDILVQRNHIETVVLDRIFEEWMREATRVGVAMPVADMEWQWFWDGFTHVDPQKESNADDTMLANGTLTYARYYAQRGLDWEGEFAQRGEEAKRLKEMGLPLPGQQSMVEQTVVDDEESA